jgi:chemotaxis response regulator CheB
MSNSSKIAGKPTEPDVPSHYIGIGASAGGLEALQALLQNLPVDTGACFVIVQHLSPDFKSMMLELLSKHTTMTVENVIDGDRTQYNLPVATEKKYGGLKRRIAPHRQSVSKSAKFAH